MKFKLLATALALVLATAGGVWAKPKAPASKMHVATGSVASMSDTNLALSHKVKGKTEQTSYTLTPDTKREGSVETGARVTVHYKAEGGQNIATLVKARPAKVTKTRH